MRLIDADALVGDIERRLCGPCRKAGDDRRGVYCRVCQVNDMLCEIDEWPAAEEAPERVEPVRAAHNSGGF